MKATLVGLLVLMAVVGISFGVGWTVLTTFVPLDRALTFRDYSFMAVAGFVLVGISAAFLAFAHMVGRVVLMGEMP